ncbi:MAG: hypothetical protein RLZZ262_2195, partial [Bacteroidota bacterium]
MKYTYFASIVLIAVIFSSCGNKPEEIVKPKPTPSQGKLFIIGGGDRTFELMEALMEAANLDSSDYIGI